MELALLKATLMAMSCPAQGLAGLALLKASPLPLPPGQEPPDFNSTLPHQTVQGRR